MVSRSGLDVGKGHLLSALLFFFLLLFLEGTVRDYWMEAGGAQGRFCRRGHISGEPKRGQIFSLTKHIQVALRYDPDSPVCT